MRTFLSALKFLTIFPVKGISDEENALQRSSVYFPLVGLCLGLILVLFDKIASFVIFDQYIINTLIVSLLAILTGGIHLDGLADTADAFFSRKNKEKMLKIMRDPHIGTMGVLAIVTLILLKLALISSILLSLKAKSLILICVLSRWSLVFSIFCFSYAREEGKAKVFMQGIDTKIFLIATMITVLISALLWGTKGLLLLTLIALASYSFSKFVNHKIDGITGDTLGANCELMELIVLIGICILQGITLWTI